MQLALSACALAWGIEEPTAKDRSNSDGDGSLIMTICQLGEHASPAALGNGVALLPVHCLAHGFVGSILLRKVGQNHIIRNAEARRLQDFLHGMFNLFLMCSTIL